MSLQHAEEGSETREYSEEQRLRLAAILHHVDDLMMSPAVGVTYNRCAARQSCRKTDETTSLWNSTSRVSGSMEAGSHAKKSEKTSGGAAESTVVTASIPSGHK